MIAAELDLQGLVLLEPQVFKDERGYFFESFNRGRFAELTGENAAFVQDNQSISRLHVVRGMHFQVGASAQGKLVRVTSGAIFDVAVDIRRGSPTFGRWFSVELTAENQKQLWVPTGFAHGFQALAEGTSVIYKTTAFWDRVAERSICWDDPALNITWPSPNDAILSGKDRAAPKLSELTASDLF